MTKTLLGWRKKIKKLICRLFIYLKRVEERKLSEVDCAQVSAIRFMSRHGERVVKVVHVLLRYNYLFFRRVLPFKKASYRIETKTNYRY
jgi:hypothetical protein